MIVEGLTHVATYRRRVSASQQRVWENVRDWEHLDWLHDQSFSGLEYLDSGDWGWRVELSPAHSKQQRMTLELLIDAAESRYVARTLAGVGEGTEIWTTVTPVETDRTDIEVEFHLPGVRPDQTAALGGALTTLYTRLWDEDEQMMRLRESRLANRARPLHGVLELGTESSIRSQLPLEVEFAGRPFRVDELDGELIVYSAICPHLLGPLGTPDPDGRIRCPWHGYQFDLRTRSSCDGRNRRLLTTPELVIDPESHDVSLRAG